MIQEGCLVLSHEVGSLKKQQHCGLASGPKPGGLMKMWIWVKGSNFQSQCHCMPFLIFQEQACSLIVLETHWVRILIQFCQLAPKLCCQGMLKLLFPSPVFYLLPVPGRQPTSLYNLLVELDSRSSNQWVQIVVPPTFKVAFSPHPHIPKKPLQLRWSFAQSSTFSPPWSHSSIFSVFQSFRSGRCS